MKHDIVFGIDGGGTRSRIAVATLSGDILCRLEGASTNMYASSHEQVERVLTELLSDACAKCGCALSDIAGGCLGSAGLSRPNERKKFSAFFSQLLGSDVPVALCNDAEILLVGGIGKLEGICVIAGTGSIALGRLVDGTLARAGGLGWRLGDEGSAWWIVQQAVCRSLRSEERRDYPTGLLTPLLGHFGLCEAWELVPLFNGDSLDKGRIASAAPLVTIAAQDGDPLALDILHRAADELYGLVASIVRQLPELGSSRLVNAGGVFEHDDVVSVRFEAQLRKHLPQVIHEPAEGSALDGALLLAEDAVAATGRIDARNGDRSF
ncbi:MAG: BadF/BadG/BcrA/BcrD ATPase family protein [Sphaerochaetaceae bacterium]